MLMMEHIPQKRTDKSTDTLSGPEVLLPEMWVRFWKSLQSCNPSTSCTQKTIWHFTIFALIFWLLLEVQLLQSGWLMQFIITYLVLNENELRFVYAINLLTSHNYLINYFIYGDRLLGPENFKDYQHRSQFSIFSLISNSHTRTVPSPSSC